MAGGSVSAQHHGHDTRAGTERLGRVNFAISCSAEAQRRFGRALALLHSFEYNQAEPAFVNVAEVDSACAMAHWGVAMSRLHPLWTPPSSADIGVAAGARIVDPSQHLFTLQDDREINVELYVNKGRGYVESDQHPVDRGLPIDLVRMGRTEDDLARSAPGHQPLITHVFMDGDKYLDSDVVFGVKDELVARIEKRTDPTMPDGKPAAAPWHLMTYEFRMKPGEGSAPKPMMAKASEDA